MITVTGLYRSTTNPNVKLFIRVGQLAPQPYPAGYHANVVYFTDEDGKRYKTTRTQFSPIFVPENYELLHACDNTRQAKLMVDYL